MQQTLRTAENLCVQAPPKARALLRMRTATTGPEGGKEPLARKRLVILGTGWGGYSLLRNVNRKLYDVIVISPRNHFLFTPLLASTTVGTLEFRSIIEPVRNIGFPNEHNFHLAVATGVDLDRQVVQCLSELGPPRAYLVPYDLLVIGVGAVPNDFRVPGVIQHAFFLKVCGRGGECTSSVRCVRV